MESSKSRSKRELKQKPRVPSDSLFMGLITSYILRDMNSFFLEIEFDCRGSSELLEFPGELVLTHHIAEAKTAKTLTDGVRQLFIRLFVISQVSNFIFTRFDPKLSLKHSLTGTLVTLTSQHKEIRSSVDSVRNEVKHPVWQSIKIVRHVSGAPAEKGEIYFQ